MGDKDGWQDSGREIYPDDDDTNLLGIIFWQEAM